MQMRCQSQDHSHLICPALHPLGSHLYYSLFPLVSLLFIFSSYITLTLSPRALGAGGKWGVLWA